MSIAYTYQIIAVSEQYRTMEILYSSPGRQSMHVGARLPYEGETVEAIVQMFSPVAHWLAQEATVVVPAVGTAGEITPPPSAAPPPARPAVVTMRQARLALLQAGLLSQVAVAISALPSPEKEAAEIEWEYSQTMERDRPFVSTLGAALSLTDAQIDELFALAATL